MNRTLNTIPELVAFALFDLDPRVRQAQRPLHYFMVSLALFEATEPLDDRQLVGAVGDLLPISASVSAAQVTEAAEMHRDLGLLDRDADGRMALSTMRRDQMTQAQGRLAHHRAAFHEHMSRTVVDHVGTLVQEDKAALFEALENRVQGLLAAQSSELASAWSTTGKGFDAALAELNAREHLREVANLLAPGGAQPNALRRTALLLGLERGFKTLPPDAAEYLAAVFQRTVAFALLEQDPTVRRVKGELAGRRIAYLDTNVVMAAMFDADTEHDLAVQVVELTRTLNAELRVTQFTVEELSRRIDDANRFMSRYHGSAVVREVVDDVVVRSYHRATRVAPALAWSAFVGGFDPPGAWLAENDITVEREHCDETESDRRVEDARAEVSRIRPQTSVRVLTTDALNLIHVDRTRRNNRADEMGGRVWLVTFDRALARADRRLVQNGKLDAGVIRLSQTWVDLLSPCLPPENGELSGYVSHLVQSQFGLLAEDPMFVEKDFLLTITQNSFDVSDVLSGSPDRARQTLIRLQKDRELKELIGDPHPDQEEWKEHLRTAVLRALEEIEESPEREAELAARDQARAEAEVRAEEERRSRLQATRDLAEARTNMASVTQERDELAEQLHAELARPFWKRMLRIFSAGDR